MTKAATRTAKPASADYGLRIADWSASETQSASPSSRTCRFLNSRSRHAFTLIELLVVIAIIGILLVLVGVSWRQVTGDRLEVNALNAIEGAMRAGRARALELGGDVALVYDHNGSGGLYLHAPPGHPRHDRALSAQLQTLLGDRYQPDALFIRDQEMSVAPLDPDVRVAPLSLAESRPGFVAARDVLSAAGAATLHVAIVFDSSGRLRERPVIAIAPSIENQAAGVRVEFNQVIATDSQRGAVAFRLTRANAAVNGTVGLDMRKWLADPQNGGTLVANPWTGRAMPGVVAD